MKLWLLFFSLVLHPVFGKNILILGDSHSAGPFGKYLFQNFAQNKDDNAVIYGHASSAAVHWLGEKAFKLSGGVYHSLSLEGELHRNPNESHWREKIEVPKLSKVLREYAIHQEWKNYVNQDLRIDVVVIALGANDAHQIVDPSGKELPGFETRKKANRRLAELALAAGAQCFWIGPPDGEGKSPHHNKAIYKMLEKSTLNKCKLFNSSKFYADGCDGIHFNCASAYPKAKKWAQEAFDFVTGPENL